jgi:hypothetical protein
MKAVSLIAVLCVLPVAAAAQDFGLSAPSQIQSETLGDAQDFDAGVLRDGSLGTNLWQGTSAGWAAQLLSRAPLKSDDPLISEMIRTVILSGGVPPRANSSAEAQAYESARLQAVLAVESGRRGDTSTLDDFLARNSDLARAPLAQVDLALSKGNWQRACEISDTITTERALPEWARLRATCHALRGEISAADVTRDLLRTSGYDNPAYHAQMDALLSGQGPSPKTDPTDALVSFLATRGAINDSALAGGPEVDVGPSADLAALFNSFEDTDLNRIQSALGNMSFDIARGDLDFQTALSDPSPRAAGRLFVLGQSGNAAALDAFISRAVAAGVDEDKALLKLTPIIQALPAQNRAGTNLIRYVRAALVSRDIDSLQQLHAALPSGNAQSRIALIADALGGGFYGQTMGRDIESRVAAPSSRAQAITDAQIAFALGGTLSDSAAQTLSTQNLPALTLPQSELLLLKAALRDNSQAEVSLLIARLLSRPGLNISDKSHLISALTEANLPQFAGPIAADIFFDGFDSAL